MEANTAAKVSVVQTTLSCSKSLSVGSSPNQLALLAAFTAWAAMWRVVAEQHAKELQKTVEAAATWRSQMRSRFAKVEPNKGSASITHEPATEELQESKLGVDGGVVSEGHDVELQRALEAASAWRSRMQKARPQSKVATTPKSGTPKSGIRGVDGSTHNLVGCAVEASAKSSGCFVPKGHAGGLVDDLSDNLSDTVPDRQVEVTSDAHDAELQEALDAAAKWRSRFQSKEQVQEKDAKECVAPSQDRSSQESNSPCDFQKKQGGRSPLTAILQEDLADTGSTTTASGDEDSCSSSDSDVSPTCWVFGAYLRDVSKISADGVRLRGRRVRLYAGPWGRTGLCRRNEEVLVYIDVLGARTAGAEFRYSQRGLVLSEGVIPAACCRKMVMIKDGSVLYDRTALEP